MSKDSRNTIKFNINIVRQCSKLAPERTTEPMKGKLNDLSRLKLKYDLDTYRKQTNFGSNQNHIQETENEILDISLSTNAPCAAPRQTLPTVSNTNSDAKGGIRVHCEGGNSAIHNTRVPHLSKKDPEQRMRRF